MLDATLLLVDGSKAAGAQVTSDYVRSRYRGKPVTVVGGSNAVIGQVFDMFR